jgi:hypothetical protein
MAIIGLEDVARNIPIFVAGTLLVGGVVGCCVYASRAKMNIVRGIGGDIIESDGNHGENKANENVIGGNQQAGYSLQAGGVQGAH